MSWARRSPDSRFLGILLFSLGFRVQGLGSIFEKITAYGDSLPWTMQHQAVYISQAASFARVSNLDLQGGNDCGNGFQGPGIDMNSVVGMG